MIDASSMTKAKKRLVKLYAQMAELTKPECAQCSSPHSCCSQEYCELTIQWAAKAWGVTLERTDGRDTRGGPLPLMGPTGCTAAPHLRPICTVHTCDINSLGFKKGDLGWTERYFKLRDALDNLESTDALERMEKRLPEIV
jgi:hypothetical protein